MEFMTGVKEKETLELSELLEEGRLGEEVKVNGAVHTIRDMGTVAFVILRKREGLVQCVYEEGVTKFNLKDLREAATVEVTGKLTESEKSPNGIDKSTQYAKRQPSTCCFKVETEHFPGSEAELSFHFSSERKGKSEV